MKIIRYKIEERSCEIWLGSLSIRRLTAWLKAVRADQVVVVYDTIVKSHGKKIFSQLSSGGFLAHSIGVEVSEKIKYWNRTIWFYERFLDLKLSRKSVVLVVGGGALGDVVGFVASTFLRGLRWVNVPTTLLAQVDSGIGGKTAINLKRGKNLVGSFHSPEIVIIDPTFLTTLPVRDRVSGFGEILKYGLIYDQNFFETLTKNTNQILALKKSHILHAIEASVRWKLKAVLLDYRDQLALREILNFGHTFGHALEASQRFNRFRHGEAVIIGMRLASALSYQRKMITLKEFQKIEFTLRRLVPFVFDYSCLKACWPFIKKDKKNDFGKIHFVLLEGIGRASCRHRVNEKDLSKAFQLLESFQ